jgi:hypothetical protein
VSSRGSFCILLSSLAAALLALSSPAQGKLVNGVHEDPVNGFAIQPPPQWEIVPVRIDEKWIAAKYNCDREYTNKGSGDGFIHRPRMQVVIFSPEKLRTKEKADTRGDTTYIEISNVFRGYKDYVGGEMKGQGLGYHIVSEEEGKVRGIPVTKLTISAEEGNTKVKLTFVTWIFARHQDGTTVAVEFSVLEDRYETLRKDFERSLNSFRFIEKTAEASTVDLENPLWTLDRTKWRQLKPLERIQMRKKIEEQRKQQYIATLPQGWITQPSKSGAYFAISHADKDYTKRIIDIADAARAWLDAHLGDVSDEYVMTGILRICRDRDEWLTYRKSSGAAGAKSFSTDDREVVDYQEVDIGGLGAFNIIGEGLLNCYLFDKDAFLLLDLPHWLHLSLEKYFRDADVRGNKLVSKPSTWETVHIKEAKRESQLLTLQKIMTTVADDWPDDQKEANYQFAQRTRAVRYLLDGPGKSHKLLKDFIPRYMKATITASEEWQAANPPEQEEQAKTVEQEEEQSKMRSKYWENRRRFILDKVTAECCNFSEKEWEQLNKSFAKYLVE